MPYTNSLSGTQRGVMRASILSKLASISEIKLSSTSGRINVTTSNATLISRVNNNRSLSRGQADNAHNNAWAGTGAILLTRNASCTRYSDYNLSRKIFHGCGNVQSFHWIPFSGRQREQWNQGEVSNGTYFRLWVKGTGSPLPIELLEFSGQSMGAVNQINWITASEINNERFIVHRSIDAHNWEPIAEMSGAGNSSTEQHYEVIDAYPLSGVNYYRLERIDYDGTSASSEIIAVMSDSQARGQLQAYPNPCSDKLRIRQAGGFVGRIDLYSPLGELVMSSVAPAGGSTIEQVLDLSSLPLGSYYLRSSSGTQLIMKY